MAHRDNAAAARSSSDTGERPTAKALADDSRRTMLRRRVRRIRRSIALFAAALFSAAFLMVYVQLASGHDPALVADARRASTQVTVSSSSASGAQAKTASGTTGSSESVKAPTSATATAVTTSQS
jgi:hypothetical protein